MPSIAEDRRTPQQLAKDAADRYFDALASDLPFDVAPGKVNLVEACVAIQDALLNHRPIGMNISEDEQDAAMRAGYLLGVEMGRRLGGPAR